LDAGGYTEAGEAGDSTRLRVARLLHHGEDSQEWRRRENLGAPRRGG